jgi:uncharacterized protein YyaL (SSP411 family)
MTNDGVEYPEVPGRTAIYICRKRSCSAPVFSAEDALALIMGERARY